MKLEEMMQPENLKINNCSDFMVMGSYSLSTRAGEEVRFAMKYEVNKKKWVMYNVDFYHYYFEENTEFKEKYLKKKKKFDQLILKQTKSQRKEIKKALFLIKKMEISRNYQIDYSQQGNHHKILTLDENTGDEQLRFYLGENNTIDFVELKMGLMKEINFIFYHERVNWMENLEDFRSYLLIESKDRVRLLIE